MLTQIKMRVAMYYSNKDVRLEEMDVPRIGYGEILVRVESSGICGTDVLEWYRVNKVPLVLGHEIAGIIEEIGGGVKSYKKGDRISASHHVPCNTCLYCKAAHQTVCDTLRKTNFEPGGFSEFVRLPAINVDRGVYLLPDEVSLEEATFLEPLACVIRGQRLAQMTKGKTVLVIGSGVSGILHIQLARANGASKIMATDIVDFRLSAAKKFGADSALKAGEYNPEVFRQFSGGRLADAVILCTGALPAIKQALGSVERGGTILFFAPTEKGATIPLSVNDVFWRNEVTMASSYAATPDEHREALEYIRNKTINVKALITHRLPLSQAQEGFRLVAEAQDSLKVIIKPQR